MNTRFDLDDKEWALIEPLLPKGLRGARRVDDRRILNGIFNILRTGSPWRDLPERYGAYTTCYNRYNRWSKRGVFKGIFDKLARQSKHSLHMIDSTIVRAHRAAAGAKGGSWPRVLAAHAAVARRSSMPWSTDWEDHSPSR
jgi:transposase